MQYVHQPAGPSWLRSDGFFPLAIEFAYHIPSLSFGWQDRQYGNANPVFPHEWGIHHIISRDGQTLPALGTRWEYIPMHPASTG